MMAAALTICEPMPRRPALRCLSAPRPTPWPLELPLPPLALERFPAPADVLGALRRWGPLPLVSREPGRLALLDRVPLSRSALRAVLGALHRAGLVQRTRGGWRRVERPCDPEALLRATLDAEQAVGALPPPPPLPAEDEPEDQEEEDDYLTTGWGYEPPDWPRRALERLFDRRPGPPALGLDAPPALAPGTEWEV